MDASFVGALRETQSSGPGDVLDQLPLGVLVVDTDGEVVFENDRLRSIWGSFVRHPRDAIFPADARSTSGRPLGEDEWPIRASVFYGAEVDGMRIELERADGDPVSLRVSSRPLMEGSQIVGAVMTVDDVTDQVDHNIVRDNFVSVLSHELRTPITSIFSAVGLLGRASMGDEMRATLVKDIATEAESLHRIVEDLLVMARLERHLDLVVTEPVLAQRVISAAVADERRRWPETVFVESLPRDMPPVAADEGLLRQVLRNLLSNAAKYGRQGGTVAVTANTDGDSVRIGVADEGPGIPVAIRDRVFDLFYRADTAQRSQGAGIGLYVVRALVEAMRGRIEVGGGPTGAVFTFRLPVWVDRTADLDEDVPAAT